MSKTRQPLALAALAGALLISACSSAGSPPMEEPVSKTEAAPKEEVSPAPPTSDRGHIIKTVGQPGGLGAEEPLAVEFTVTSIEVDPGCTNEYASASERGHFIVIGFEAESTPDAEGEFAYGPDSWQLIDENGVTANGSPNTGPAWGCLANDERAPMALGVASKNSGKIVLDSPITTGTLVFRPAYNFTVDTTGWEWTF